MNRAWHRGAGLRRLLHFAFSKKCVHEAATLRAVQTCEELLPLEAQTFFKWHAYRDLDAIDNL